ncbi:phage tail protein [Tolypothrix tenuis PCC 7101]|uniref:Phage tail protein n=1 Tax=Tolypothrix tenuis PCC 7101 TaxID=231146 RepID=A0A1Z4N4F0_9CYAN|nr:phage tail protein [Aulosira sp. FACHB-113]BAZ00619.1 phage tail protein [Tolypothrix tenuis PCC 7101]BAZ75459.1 phage tail protein [Aulosira laxa NIES-50]
MAKSQKKKGGDSQDKPHDPYMAFNFTVEIEGLTVGGFSEVTGLNSKIELETYVEGGVNHRVHQFPKYITYPNLVLIRGLAERDDLWKWYEDVTRGKIRLLNGTIMVRDNQQSKLIGWNFKKAYPVAWDGPQLNAGNGNVVGFERLELVHRGVYKA